MPEITYAIDAKFSGLIDGLRAASAAAKGATDTYSMLDQVSKRLADVTGNLAKVTEDLGKKRSTGAKAAGEEKKGHEDIAKAVIMAERAHKDLIGRLDLSARSQEVLAQVSGQYSEILSTTGKRVSDLGKEWTSALSPAEKTARKLAELQAFTSEADRGTKAYAATVGELAKKLDDQIRRQDANVGSQNKLSRSLAELIDGQTKANTVTALSLDWGGKQTALLKEQAEAYGRSKQRLDALETSMEALSIPGSGLVTRFKQMSDGLETISEKGTPMQASMLKVGIAVGAVGAAVAAAVVGVAAMGAAIVGVVAKSDEWNHELDALGLKLDDVGTAKINRAAASVDAVGSSFKAAGVAMATQFAPVVEQASTRMVALGLASVDAFNNLGKGEGVMAKIAKFSATVLTEALFLPITAVAKLGKAFGGLAKMAGFDAMADGAREFGNIVKGWKADQAEAVGAALKMMARDGMEPLIAATDDYMGRARELVTRQAAVNAEARQGKKDNDELRESIEKLGRNLPGFEDDILAGTKAMYDWGESAKLADGKFRGLSQNMGPTAKQIEDSVNVLGDASKKMAEAAAGKASIGDMFGKAMGGASSVLGIVESISSKLTGMSLSDLFAAKKGDAGKFLADALTDAAKELPKTMPVILSALAGGIAALGSSLGPALPGIVSSLMDGLVAAMPTIGAALGQAGGSLLIGAVEAIPTLITGITRAIPTMVGSLVVELAKASPDIIVALVKATPLILEALWRGISSGLLGLLAAALDALGFDGAADKLRGYADKIGGTTGLTSRPDNRAGGTVAPTGGTGYKDMSAQGEAMPVSDAYIPRGGPRVIRMAPDDEADIRRAGQMSGRDNGELLREMREQTAAIREQTAAWYTLRSELVRRNVNVAGGARAH